MTSKGQITKIASRDGVDARVVCRDFLDLDLLLGEQDLASVTDLFRKKATHRGLDPATFAEKLEKRVHDYEDHWDEELSQYLGQVPHFDGVERNVRRALRKAGLI